MKIARIHCLVGYLAFACAVLLALPHYVGAQDAASLSGNYICTRSCPAGGEGNIARIELVPGSITFINEGGQKSSGYFKSQDEVIAKDWNNLRGVVKENGKEIHWDNGTIWQRAQYPSLSGSYVCTKNCPAGGEGNIAKIEQEKGSLTFINEGGQKSSGYFKNQNEVVAKDWNNLRGVVKENGKEIHWDNGTIWQQGQYPSLSGSYICTKNCPAGGEGNIAKIEQGKDSLTFINEGGQKSSGYFKNQNEVVAKDWNNLRGVVKENGKEIHWDNGTIWRRK